jgi:DNA-binding transcriptional MerR regulator
LNTGRQADTVSHVEFPEKLFFKIGEVAKIAGVKQHVLRYWESEFPWIRPQKSKSNQRLYRRKDVEAVLAIKHLLYDRKFTIEGAKKHLKSEGVEAASPPPNVEDVAAKARRDALEEGRETTERFQKDLLSIRQATVDFLKDLDRIEGEDAKPSI